MNEFSPKERLRKLSTGTCFGRVLAKHKQKHMIKLMLEDAKLMNSRCLLALQGYRSIQNMISNFKNPGLSTWYLTSFPLDSSTFALFG